MNNCRLPKQGDTVIDISGHRETFCSRLNIYLSEEKIKKEIQLMNNIPTSQG